MGSFLADLFISVISYPDKLRDREGGGIDLAGKFLHLECNNKHFLGRIGQMKANKRWN